MDPQGDVVLPGLVGRQVQQDFPFITDGPTPPTVSRVYGVGGHEDKSRHSVHGELWNVRRTVEIVERNLRYSIGRIILLLIRVVE